jgi:hypothetical protein
MHSHDPDHVSPQQEYLRLAGKRFMPRHALHSTDNGDGGEYLYEHGWVVGWGCDGGYVGVVYNLEEEEWWKP